MKIYLMRHGETDWNKSRRLQGQSDIPLNAFGVELAEKTAEGLKDVDFDMAFSSPLERAFMTAKIVMGERPVPVITDRRLMEINFGEGEGQVIATAKQDPDHPMHNFLCRPEAYVPLRGGETFDQVRERGAAFLREQILPREGDYGNVLIVAHGAFLRTMLTKIAGISDKEFWTISLPNCGVWVLSLDNGVFSILLRGWVYYGTPVNERP